MRGFDLPMNPDTRAARGGWYTGYYMSTCPSCKEEYLGGKRSIQCSECAYSESRIEEQLELDLGGEYDTQ